MDRLAELEAENAELRAKLAAMEAVLRNSSAFRRWREVTETQAFVVANIEQERERLAALQQTAARHLKTLLQIGVDK